MATYIFMAVSEYRKFLDSLTPEQLTAYRKEQRESAKRQYQKNKELNSTIMKCEYCNSKIHFGGMRKHYTSKKCQAIPADKIKQINKDVWDIESDERILFRKNSYTDDAGKLTPNF